MKNTLPCPCHSNKPYRDCCQRYHDGIAPENALILMRSRYSAYALHLADYIIQTTHPDHPTYSSNHSYWKQEILQNTKNMLYEGLTIIEFIDGAQDAYVTFTAHLRHGKKNISFTEKSYFIKTNNIWFYKYGELKK